MAVATNPYYIKALLSGSVWDNDQTGVTLDYMFYNNTPNYYSIFDYESDGFEAFTPLMETAVYEILANIEKLINVTFNEIFTVNQTELGFGQAILTDDAEAWAYYPDPADNAGGDVWVNTTYFTENDLDHGEYDYATLIHEIGHALGLKHSFEGPKLPKNEDNTQYTIMSYTDAPQYGGLQPETFMLYDIAALQKLYGANMTFATGNDTYALLSGHIYTIWDAGGTDLLDGSALAGNLVLDLNAGKFSSAGLVNNIAIAYNVTIENATGGTGNDTLIGNAADNLIDGGLGNDIASFTGSILNFTFDFTGPSTCIGHSTAGGDDTFDNIETFNFTGSSWSFAQLETYFSDQVLTGNALVNDTLTGGGGDDILDGLSGADKMNGGAGSDTYFVDNTGDRSTEINGLGTDTVNSTVSWTLGTYFEDLILLGTALKGTGNGLGNSITGNAASNSLNGSSGNDIIDGGGGFDVLQGGTGADTFVFHDPSAYSAIDVIKDFKVTQGDVLDLRDMLAAYDPLTEALSDFVQIAQFGTASGLFVDPDGTGVAAGSQIATLNGVKGITDVDALVLAGNLLVS